jgi:uncharacterized membrane protein YfcA
MMTIVALCFFAFLAGFIDSIVGGGGLIQLPGMLVTLPDYPVQKLLGTGKIPSFCGTFAATLQYAKHVHFNWKFIITTSICALTMSSVGSSLVQYIDSQSLKPIILILLIFVAIYTFIKKDLGSLSTKSLSSQKSLLYGILMGCTLGFYDGFFGPGTGSFLILGFITIFGFDFINASANAKIVNLFTNIGSIIVFGLHGSIVWQFAIPMAVMNLTGSFIGSRLALLRGNGFVRKVFLGVIFLMIIRYSIDIFKI